MQIKQRQGQKYLWMLPEYDTKFILELASTYNVSLSIIQTIIMRGLTTKDKIDAYLFGSKHDNAAPSLLYDAQKAVERIIEAINKQEKILIFGDYDVDGITSTALMINCLKSLGAHVNFFLPHRVHDGYGLSTTIVQRAALSDYKLIITVDNGISAFEAAEYARKHSIDLIITDHHKPHEHLPCAYAIVNPHRSDCTYPYKDLAGVGVAFKVLSLLCERMKEPMSSKAYELLLLGTVADVVPLTGENRFWVRHSLQLVNRAESYALQVLKRNGKVVKPTISSLDIGYALAPQINALGRMEDPRRAVEFLISSDKQSVEKIGGVLYELNEARKDVERSIVAELEEAVLRKKIDLDVENIILAGSKLWPPGVIGLVASRMVSTFGRPALLFHLDDNGIAKGSCRSISSFNIFKALKSCSHLIEKFGGHSCAAGLTIKQENLPALKQELERLILQQLTPFDLQQKITIDAEVHLAELTKKFIKDMAFLEPFGAENAQPLFYIKQVSLAQPPKILKDVHVKCMICADGIVKPIIFFNRPDLIDIFFSLGSNPFDVVAYVNENYWNGRSNIELTGVDIAHEAA